MTTLSITGDAEADALLSRNPFALIVGMVLDQQIRIEHAFAAPKALSKRLGGRLDPATVASTDPARLVALFSEKPALHRFPSSMASRVLALARVIVDQYGGDTEAIWKTAASGDELVQDLAALPGFGTQKAKIFAALLAKQLGVRPSGWREATSPYGDDGALRSVADIDSPESLVMVREHKRQMKAAAKSVVRSSEGRATRSTKR
ncbi:MAG: HhH-GPD-type base excision DNA repair protein [Acidimicrobiales bacterium]